MDDIKFLFWEDVRTQVSKLNPKLAHLIDDVSPGKKYGFLKIKNPFGQLIVDTGKFMPTQLQKHITYSSIPLFLSLDKSLEVFVTNYDRVIPLNLMEPGNLLGAFEIVDALFGIPSVPKWSVCSGARSILVLAKITDQLKYQKLNIKYDLAPTDRVKNLRDHWHLFKKIINHPNFNHHWCSTILVFTDAWFDKSRNNSKAWGEFYDYIFSWAWNIAKFASLKFEIELEWEGFISAISDRHLKPNPYIFDTMKHLILMGAARFPGLRPAIDDKAAPIKALQIVLTEEYQLQKYLPSIMHTAPLNSIIKNKPVYYSLSYPILLEGSPLVSGNKTLMMDLKEIILNINTAKERSNKSSIIKQIDFNYFHTEMDHYKVVKPSEQIVQGDPAFLRDQKHYPDRTFPANSQFWKGCISLTQLGKKKG